MKHILISLAVLAGLSGCVVTSGHHRAYVAPPVVDIDIVYPLESHLYIWDAGEGRYYFHDHRGQRRYMQRGWDYRRDGPPKHKYRD